MRRATAGASQDLITVTPQALGRIRATLREAGREGYWLRVELVGRGEAGFLYRLTFIPSELHEPEDILQPLDRLRLVIDPLSARYLTGATLRYLESAKESGFKIDNPNPLWRDPLAAASPRR